MAGSIKSFIYIANNGNRYAVNIDESNAKTVVISNYSSTGQSLFPPIEAPFPGRPPKGFVMRSVATVGYVNKKARRKFWVGKKSAWEELLTGEKYIYTDNEYWGVVSGKEEKVPRPFVDAYFDTGLNDGNES